MVPYQFHSSGYATAFHNDIQMEEHPKALISALIIVFENLFKVQYHNNTQQAVDITDCYDNGLCAVDIVISCDSTTICHVHMLHLCTLIG